MSLSFLVYCSQPLIAAFTGWFTTWIAFVMLFHPRYPVRILGITIQGIFPKRRQVFAAKLGAVVGNQLLHFNEIASQIKDPTALAEVMPAIEQHIDAFLNQRLQEKLPALAMFLSASIKEKIKEGLMEEINRMLPEVIAAYADNLSQKIDIEKMVYEKVNNFSLEKLEELLHSVMKREFKFVELIGGVFGFIIGLFQLLLSIATG